MISLTSTVLVFDLDIDEFQLKLSGKYGSFRFTIRNVKTESIQTLQCQSIEGVLNNEKKQINLLAMDHQGFPLGRDLQRKLASIFFEKASLIP